MSWTTRGPETAAPVATAPAASSAADAASAATSLRASIAFECSPGLRDSGGACLRARAAPAAGPGRSGPEVTDAGLRPVDHAERPHECELPGDEHDGGENEKNPRLAHRDSSPSRPRGRGLETNVLQRFGCLPVQPCGLAVVVPPV